MHCTHCAKQLGLLSAEKAEEKPKEKSGKVGRKLARKCPIIWPGLLGFWRLYKLSWIPKTKPEKEVFQTNAETALLIICESKIINNPVQFKFVDL